MTTDLIKNPPELNVDLSDPQSVAEKLPEIEEIVAEKGRLAVEAARDFEYWEQIFGKLRWLAGLILDLRVGDDVSQGAIEAVVAIVEREDRGIMAVGVAEALEAEGHRVQGPLSVKPVLEAAAGQGLLQEFAPGSFAPLGMPAGALPQGMQAVPEAHLGLSDPPPTSKAEATLRVLGSEPNRAWSAQDVAEVMASVGWIEQSPREVATLTSTLSRLHAEMKIFRPGRGQYQLAPPVEALEE